MDKKHIEDLKKSKIWEKQFKNVEDTIDNGILKDDNIPQFVKSMQLIIRTSDTIMQLSEKHLAKYDLSIAQKGVLAALYFSKSDYLTQIQLSKYVYTSKSNISSLLERMERKGFVKREENSENKREKKVILTNDGKNILKTLIKDSQDMPIDKLITNDEAIILNKLLMKIKDGYKMALKK